MSTNALFLLPVVLSLAGAFPNGAHNNGSNPIDSLSSYCTAGNFRPNHGSFLPQASPSPYVITVTSRRGAMYSPNQIVTITIESQQTPPSRMFKGFFLQGDSTEGSFAGDIVCANQQGKTVTFCSKKGVTHTNAIPKSKLTCTWTPPDFQLGQVQFTATVLENFTTFWTGVKSEVTLYSDPSTMTYTQKGQQMSQNLMKQFQGAKQNMLSMFQQSTSGSGNPMATLMNSFSKNAGAKSSNGNANPLANLMSAFGQNGGATQYLQGNSNGGQQSNPFASLLSGNRGSQQGQATSYWQTRPQSNQNNQGLELNNFRQFFQS